MTSGSIVSGSPVYQRDRFDFLELVQTPYTKVWSGVDFSSRAARQLNPDEWHSYNCRIQTRRYPMVSSWTNGPNSQSSGARYYNNLYGMVSNTPPLPILDAALWDKLAQKVNSHNFNAAISFAEAPQSLRMLLDSARRVGNLIKHLRKGNIVKALQAVSPSVTRSGRVVHYRVLPFGTRSVRRINGKLVRSDFSEVRSVRVRNSYDTASLSGLWLELQWGWKPFFSDIFEAFNAFYAQTSAPRKYRASVSKTIRATPYAVSNGSWGPPPECHFKKCNVYTKLVLTAEVSESSTPWDLTGFNDPLSVAWEKIPLSCVVDWLVPVATYLSARRFIKSQEGGSYATTAITRTDWDMDYIVLNPYGNFRQRVETSFHSVLDVLIVRSAMTPMSYVGRALGETNLKPLVSGASLSHLVTSMALWRHLSR